MRILLSNDDGFNAPGIATLRTVLSEFGEVVTVAPATPQSGISHQMTFEVPMTLIQTSESEWHLTGTPADCTRVGLTQLGLDFDWVFSGINNGGNLGVDFYISGTVAAAREATFFGKKAVAISQHRRNFPGAFDWKKAQRLARRVVSHLMDSDIEDRELININLPDCTQRDDRETDQVQIVECEIDRNPLPFTYDRVPTEPASQDPNFGKRSGDPSGQTPSIGDSLGLLYSGKYNDRQRTPGSDTAICMEGSVAITRH